MRWNGRSDRDVRANTSAALLQRICNELAARFGNDGKHDRSNARGRVGDTMTRVICQTRLRRLGHGLCLAAVMAVAGCGVDDEGRMARANEAFEAGDYRAAAVDARAVLKNDSRNLEARLLLARSALEFGDGASAEKEFRRAVDLGVALDDVGIELARSLGMQRKNRELLDEFPTEALPPAVRPELYLLRGTAQRELGETEAAIQSLEEAVRLDSSLVGARIVLLGIAMDEGELTNASMMLEQLRVDAADDVSLWMLSARYQLISQDTDAAIADYSRALELARASGPRSQTLAPLYGLFDVELGTEQVDAARSRLAELKEIAPDLPGTTLREAKIAFLEEDWETAKPLLQQTLKQADSPVAKELLGFVHYKLGEFAQADMMLSSVVGPDVGSSESVLVLAEVRRQLNRPEPVIDTLIPVLEGSENPETLSSAMRITLASGSIEDSVRVAETNAQRFPDNALLQLDLATAYAAAGRLQDADAVLGRLESVGEASVQLRRNALLALTQMRSNELDAASVTAATLAKDFPEEPLAQMLAGDIAFDQGNFELAKTRFEAAASLAPEDPVPVKNLARVAAAQGDFDTAGNLLERALTLLPDDVGAYVGLSQIALRSGDRDSAIQWLERALQADPGAARVARELARQKIANGNMASARTTIVSAMQSAPNDTSLAMLLGEISLANGEVDDAIEQFGAVVGMDETLPDGYRGLAIAYLADGRDDQARTVLRRAGRRGASDVRSDMMLAMLNVRGAEYGQAQRLVDTWMEQEPTADSPYVVQGEIYMAREELARASQSFEEGWSRRKSWNTAARHAVAGLRGELGDPMALAAEFSESAPDHLPSKVLLAQGHQALGNPARAIPYYERALSLEPGNAGLRNNYAWALFETGDSRALEQARQAYAANDGPAIADTLGWILAREGNVQEALPLLQSAHERVPENSEIAWHLAFATAENGDTARARQLLDQALSRGDAFTGRSEAQALRERL